MMTSQVFRPPNDRGFAKSTDDVCGVRFSGATWHYVPSGDGGGFGVGFPSFGRGGVVGGVTKPGAARNAPARLEKAPSTPHVNQTQTQHVHHVHFVDVPRKIIIPNARENSKSTPALVSQAPPNAISGSDSVVSPHDDDAGANDAANDAGHDDVIHAASNDAANASDAASDENGVTLTNFDASDKTESTRKSPYRDADMTITTPTPTTPTSEGAASERTPLETTPLAPCLKQTSKSSSRAKFKISPNGNATPTSLPLPLQGVVTTQPAPLPSALKKSVSGSNSQQTSNFSPVSPSNSEMCDSVERVTVQGYDIAPPSLVDRLSYSAGPVSPRTPPSAAAAALSSRPLLPVQRDASSASEFTLSTVQFTSTPVSFDARQSTEMIREASVTFDIVRRTESLESRDNPFRPEGDLSKEVAPIVEAYKLKNPAASPLSSPEPATPDPLPPTPPVTPEAEIVVDVGAVELESAPPTTPTPTKSPTSPQNGAAASNGKSTAASPSSGENGAVADAEDVARRTDKKKDVDGCCQKCAVM